MLPPLNVQVVERLVQQQHIAAPQLVCTRYRLT
jgi:hypothetical protein